MRVVCVGFLCRLHAVLQWMCSLMLAPLGCCYILHSAVLQCAAASQFCDLPRLTSVMCLASRPGRQHQFCMALCTMPRFFTLYLVSGLGCSTKACHCVLWLVASCCAVLCCAVLCCGALTWMQYSCMAACAVPSSILLSCAVLINPYCNSPVLKVARPSLIPEFSVGPHFISSSSFSFLLF